MKYKFLNNDHIKGIKEEKLAALEIEHEKLSMDLKLADLSGIQNDSVNQARQQLDILEVQHSAVLAWLGLDNEVLSDDEIVSAPV